MALIFKYGVVGSAKTMNLLVSVYSYEQQGKKVKVVKPKIDTRYGINMIESRVGLNRCADIVLTEKELLKVSDFDEVDCIFVDEGQFLSNDVIDQLKDIGIKKSINVVCYGLRTDFRGVLFEGSKRLFETADRLEEIEMECTYCKEKASYNMKHIDGLATIEGPSIEIGGDEKYLPVCYIHYCNKLAQSGYTDYGKFI